MYGLMLLILWKLKVNNIIITIMNILLYYVCMNSYLHYHVIISCSRIITIIITTIITIIITTIIATTTYNYHFDYCSPSVIMTKL